MSRIRRLLSLVLLSLSIPAASSASTVRLVDDIGDHLPIAAGSQPFALATTGARVTFLAQPSDESGVRLYSSDGTAEGTRELALDGLVGIADTGLLVGMLDGLAIYALRAGADSYLVATDGSPAATRLLRRDAVTLPFEPGTSHARSVQVGGALLFLLRTGSGTGSLEVWRTAGSTGTTWRVDALPPGVDVVEWGPVASADAIAYFVVSASWSSPAVWRSDGTSSGTFELIAIDSACWVEDLAALDASALFVTSCGEASTLWSSDGTRAGTLALMDVSGIRWHAAFDRLATDGHSAVFTRASSEHPLEVWVTRGGPDFTRLIARIDDHDENQYASGFAPFTAVLGDRVLLAVVGTDRRLDLWSVDLASGASSKIATAGSEGHYLVDGASDGDRAWLAIVETADRSSVWTSDGTSGGTIPLFRAERPSAAEEWDDLHLGTPVDGRILFTFRAGYAPTLELWSSWGTPEGTRRLTSEMTRAWRGFGFDPPAARDLAATGATTFFAAADPYFGWELWRADAQEAARVADLRLDRAGIDWLEVLGEIDGELVVAATDPFTDRWEIVSISPGAGGSRPLFERPFDCSRHGCNVPRAVYPVGEWAVYLEWGSDVAPSIALGFDPATGAVEDLLPTDWHATGEEAQPSRGELVLLGANEGTTAIFVTDGTSVGTRRLVTFPGAYSNYYASIGRVGERWILWESSWPEQRILAFDLATRQLETLIDDDRLGFVRWVRTRDGLALDFEVTPPPDEPGSHEVWFTDGTVAGTRRAFLPSSRYFSRLAADGTSSTFLLSGYDYPSGDSELWISDGTPERSRRILADPGSSLVLDGPVVAHRGLLFFELGAQRDLVERRELWRTDGSIEGTYRLHAASQGESGIYLYGLEPTAVGERLLFVGRDPDHGVELWSTDGTIAGTGRLDDLEPGPASSKPEGLARFGDHLIFAAAAGGVGRELWSASGEPGSATLVTDLFPGGASSTPQVLGAFGDHLLFLADDGVVGRELWSLDGAEHDPCFATPATLCLAGGRFRVSAGWRKFDGVSGEATAVPLTAEAGYFWFFDPANPELFLKVLDACGLPEARNFWTFAAGLTDVEVTLTIEDSVTGEARRIDTRMGEAFHPSFDAGSFHVCESAAARRPATLPEEMALGPALSLLAGRFEAEVHWRFPGASGVGEAVALSDQAGYFWFFAPDNVEIVVKVLDGCGLEPYPAYWVFAGGLTDLEVELTLRDSLSGRLYTVASPGGVPFPVRLDTGAFPTCP